MRTCFSRPLADVAFFVLLWTAAGVAAQEPAKKPAPTGKRAPPPVIVVPRPVIEGGLFKRTIVPGISEFREAVAGLAVQHQQRRSDRHCRHHLAASGGSHPRRPESAAGLAQPGWAAVRATRNPDPRLEAHREQFGHAAVIPTCGFQRRRLFGSLRHPYPGMWQHAFGESGAGTTF